MMKRTFGAGLVSLALALPLAFSSPAHAETTPGDDARVASEAQAAFKIGADAVEAAEWARALTAFERSRSLFSHPLTTYNIAVCQRFLGRSTLARVTFKEALAQNEGTSQMPALFVEQAKTYLAEIDKRLVTVHVRVRPAKAALLVEGRPLAPTENGTTFVAGTAPAGKPVSVGQETFTVLVDPGAALFTFSLEGHDTIEIGKTLRPGATDHVEVSMTEQPATIRLTADQKASIVRVDGVDFGPAPVLVTRSPGRYRLTVSKTGFSTYDTQVTLHPGQLYPLDARLVPETKPFYKTWWFWSSAGATALGIGLVTFLVARPGPTRPDIDRGGLDWAAQVP